MRSLKLIDREIRRLTRERPSSRPFLCEGSPIGCEVAVVGINPGSDIPFWPYWDIKTGCNKNGWLAAYDERFPRRKPTRDRIEVLCLALKPLRCLELNLYHIPSENVASLAKEDRDTALFEFMLRTAKPNALLVYGDEPIEYLDSLAGVSLIKDDFTRVSYLGSSIKVFAAKRHFARGVSRDYVRSVAKLTLSLLSR